MPSSLKYFGKKPRGMPQRAWHGAGWYYRRSSRRWKKYSVRLDRRRGHGVGTGKWKQTYDPPLRRRRRRR